MKRFKDFFSKLTILKMLLQNTYEEWIIQVWKKDLDGPYCCNGYDCGCYGCTVRELYQMTEELNQKEIEPK